VDEKEERVTVGLTVWGGAGRTSMRGREMIFPVNK